MSTAENIKANTDAQMKVISKHGDPELAEVYVASFRGDDRLLAEFVDVCDPQVSYWDKWVIIISSQFGCPIACPMCDAGGEYLGDLTTEEILAQVDCVAGQHPQRRLHKAKKFKIQFARMGEPALNPAVLTALTLLPKRYGAPGLIPCITTTAPLKAADWMEELLDIRHRVFANRPFQLQLSINSTDEAARDHLMPAPKMGLEELAHYTSRFYVRNQRKVSLNFALTKDVPVEPEAIARHFDPQHCLVKLTPLNPTIRSLEMGLETALPPEEPLRSEKLCRNLASLGFEVILSIGDTRENEIGSNCGMAVRRMQGYSQ